MFNDKIKKYKRKSTNKPSSLIQFLVDKNIAKSHKHASVLLLVFSILFLTVSFLIVFFDVSELSSQKKYDPQTINEEYYKNIRIYTRWIDGGHINY